jgi:hypothetical protein
MAKSKSSTGSERIVPTDAQSIAFVNGLVARGQAAKANEDGSLPPNVTHEIVGQTKAGDPILVRRRMA